MFTLAPASSPGAHVDGVDRAASFFVILLAREVRGASLDPLPSLRLGIFSIFADEVVTSNHRPDVMAEFLISPKL